MPCAPCAVLRLRPPRTNPDMTNRQPRPIFILCLRAQPRVEPIRALRAALKTLKRRLSLQCVSVREARKGPPR